MKIFNVATYKRDEFLFKTIDSIYNQADEINIALNSHDTVPDKLKNDLKINCFITDNSIGDGFKFYRLSESDGYYFTIDDDIIYPSNYGEYLIEKYNEYSEKHIICLHGRTFHQYPVTSYYQSPHHSFRCLGDVSNDNFVHFGGTGVMMFHTDLFKFSYEDIKYSNMADIWVGKFANEMDIKIMCVKHNNKFLRYQTEVGKDTIFNKSVHNDKIQTELINKIIFKLLI